MPQNSQKELHVSKYHLRQNIEAEVYEYEECFPLKSSIKKQIWMQW